MLDQLKKLIKHDLITEIKNGGWDSLINRSWRSVTPNRTTYTVMLNGPPFKHQHRDTRTTKGKDLESFSEEILKEELEFFADLIEDYNKETIYMEPVS